MKNFFGNGPILIILINCFMSQSHAILIINKSSMTEIISLMSSTEEGARIKLEPGEYTTFTHPNLTSVKRTLLIAEIDTNPGEAAKFKRIPDLEGDPDLRTASSAELKEEVFKIKDTRQIVTIYNFGISTGHAKNIPKKELYTPFEKAMTRYNTRVWEASK